MAALLRIIARGQVPKQEDELEAVTAIAWESNSDGASRQQYRWRGTGF